MAPSANTEKPRFADMQGLILSHYPHLDQAAYRVYTIRSVDRTKAWLRSVHARVTQALKETVRGRQSLKGNPVNVNIAFTAEGLAILRQTGRDADGLPLMPSFPLAFREGIAGRGHRTLILGNTEESAPKNWRWGGNRDVHLLLMVFVHKDDDLDLEVGQVSPPPDAMTLAAVLPPTLRLSEAREHEHFGFTDGVSQPILAGSDDAQRFPDSTHLTALGEVVLGYRDGSGDPDPVPVPTLPGCPELGKNHPEFGKNGTYLVFCQFEQHVERFRDFIRDQPGAATPADDAALDLAAKMVGRWPDGTPLVPYTNRDDNEFSFRDDPYGYGCPLGSHIRRTNPRDSLENTNVPSKSGPYANRHRIVRRGRSYGPKLAMEPERGWAHEAPSNEERGLYFMCLNADLERQFEFIQQNWVNNPAFAGLADERDPLVGDQYRAAGNRRTFTIPGLPAPVCLTGLPRFVTVRGAQYFFLPGMEALWWLSTDEAAPVAVDMSVDPGANDRKDLNGLVEALERQVTADYAPPHIKRDAHPKMHGCVLVELRVHSGIPEELRHGIFANPGHTYLGVTRFSNAFGIQHDMEYETRGMAIKLIEVGGKPLEGEKALPTTRDTQDFFMSTHDAFFLPNTRDYDYAAGTEAARQRLSLFYVPKFFLWDNWLPRGLWQLVRSAVVLAPSPLAVSYFSQTPYRLGPRQVKLRARPIVTPALGKSLPNALWFGFKAFIANVYLKVAKSPSAEANCDYHIASRNLLRHAMASFLAVHDASFEIAVQVRPAGLQENQMPIDDATRRWRERDAPFVPVATLRIPRQVFWPAPGMPPRVQKYTSQLVTLGENLSFNPWHTLADHEPLGDINDARRRIYRSMAAYRWQRNGVEPPVMTRQKYEDLRAVVELGQAEEWPPLAPAAAARPTGAV